ncbi:MAG: FlgD immunoglobulin-like domain containing protein [Candidatus Eisenbacteria bacterium]|nr:FlgD immunoglobulin-like domain containing protein [Candidatus Eisenbacteria bacterium]
MRTSILASACPLPLPLLLVLLLPLAAVVFLTPAAAWAQDGSIVAWGLNDHGQLDVPLPNENYAAIAAGGFHNAALRSDGTIVCWGWNVAGQCDVPEPNADFVAVGAGDTFTAGMKSDGSIVAWGYNAQGQCDVPEESGFVAMSVGAMHGLALRPDGSIATWGWNPYGQCDVPDPNADFVALAAGGDHSLGLKSDGTIVGWGWNPYGQCDPPEPNAFVALASGRDHSLGLRADGGLAVWGLNDFGQCDVPPPNGDFVSMDGGDVHSLAIKSDGSIVGWGWNIYGQCDAPAPNTGFAAVSGGHMHSVGLHAGSVNTGACCHPDGTCIVTLEMGCAAPAVWEGPGTACMPNPCGPVAVLLESWSVASLRQGLQIRWEIPLGAGGASYRAWRDVAARPGDLVPSADAVAVAPGWVSASSEGIVETFDSEAPRNALVRYFLETDVTGGGFLGPIEARWDPPLAGWSAGPVPFHGTVRLVAPAAGPARADIYDLAGRLVRTLARADGDAPLEWDGRDASGHDAPAGTYMVRTSMTVEAPGASDGDVVHVTRLVKIR